MDVAEIVLMQLDANVRFARVKSATRRARS